MKWRHHRHLSGSLLTVLFGAAVLGLVTLFREEPALRRYLRIARM